MKVNFKILQVKLDDSIPYAFMRYSFAKDNGLKLQDYKEIYSGMVELDDINNDDCVYSTLEDLFTAFNFIFIDRPSNFKGHSMSTSDIVVLNNVYYYVDTCDFVKLEL